MKIISGGQTGADQAGLQAAKELRIETGGWAPKDFKTSAGYQKELLLHYGLTEFDGGYKERTWANVRDSNATIRLAVDFETAGEVCTLNAIHYHQKPWIDIDLNNPKTMKDVFDFLLLIHPDILNIAGNTQNTNELDIFNMAYVYLKEILKEYKRRYLKD